MQRARVTPARLGLIALLCACGTPMRPTKLAPPLTATQGALHVHVPEVHLSQDLRRVELTPGSRVLVVLDLRADVDMPIDLREAQLTLIDFAGHAERRRALASGLGEAPQWLHDGEHAELSRLRAGEVLRVWVAFGEWSPRVYAELPERAELLLPGGSPLVLSNPGALPVWEGEAPSYSSGMGLLVQASADESAINLLINDQRMVLDPLVVNLYYGIGMRMPQLPSRDGQDIVCCNLAIGFGVSWPLLRTEEFSLAPYLGGEGAFMLSDDVIERRSWYGPALGVELSGPPLHPRHGPFPVGYPRALLGGYNVRLALVHWFGPDRDPPSLGLTAGMSVTFGN